MHITCKRYPYHLYCSWRELIRIEIEIKDRNRLKESFKNLHSKTEDLLFAIISIVPERMIPSPIMQWLNKYLDRRIAELKQESIQMAWKNLYLQDAVKHIKNPDKWPSEKMCFFYNIAAYNRITLFHLNIRSLYDIIRMYNWKESRMRFSDGCPLVPRKRVVPYEYNGSAYIITCFICGSVLHRQSQKEIASHRPK